MGLRRDERYISPRSAERLQQGRRPFVHAALSPDLRTRSRAIRSIATKLPKQPRSRYYNACDAVFLTSMSYTCGELSNEMRAGTDESRNPSKEARRSGTVSGSAVRSVSHPITNSAPTGKTRENPAKVRRTVSGSSI